MCIDGVRAGHFNFKAVSIYRPFCVHLGYYASLDPYQYNGARLDDNAILISPIIRGSSQPRCLVFYAYMYGPYVDYLNVYIRPYGQTRPFDPAYSIYGTKGRGWLRHELEFTETSDVQVRFPKLSPNLKSFL